MTTLAAAIGVALLLAGSSSIAGAAGARPIGSEQVLLVDEAFVTEPAGVRLALHPPRKTGERLLVSDRPWEDAMLNWFSVVQDGSKFRMWYECYDAAGWPTADDTSFCYAESADGIHWRKPDLGLCPYGGSTATNILFRQIGEGPARSRVHGSCVFVDPSAPPAARYKAVSQGTFQGMAGRPYLVAGMSSADGLAWSRLGQPICPVFADSQYSAFWDERLRQYVLYGRVAGRGRAIGQAASERFDTFPPLVKVLETTNQDPPESDLYNPACLRVGDLYLMCPSLYQHRTGTLDVRLAVSRDGVTWTWPDRRTPLIPLGKPGEFDSGSLYMANGCGLVGDEIWFYYSGSPLKHDEVELDKLADPRNRRVYSRAVAKRDRLVSVTAGPSGGTFLTPPLEYRGACLEVTLATRPRGRLRVGLCDAEGRPLAGLRVEDCRPLTGRDRPQTVTWGRATSVGRWAGRAVRLRFELHDADLFAFRFRG